MRVAAEQEKWRIRQWNSGTYWTPGLGQLRVAAGHGLGGGWAQDCRSVRIYASELCPRQDSNLRSRLRRPLLSPLSYGGSRTAARLPAHGGVPGVRAPPGPAFRIKITSAKSSRAPARRR